MTVRVIRIMEYRYASPERAATDMEGWEVQGTRRFGNHLTVTSSTLPPDFFFEGDDDQ